MLSVVDVLVFTPLAQRRDGGEADGGGDHLFAGPSCGWRGKSAGLSPCLSVSRAGGGDERGQDFREKIDPDEPCTKRRAEAHEEGARARGDGEEGARMQVSDPGLVGGAAEAAGPGGRLGVDSCLDVLRALLAREDRFEFGAAGYTFDGSEVGDEAGGR